MSVDGVCVRAVRPGNGSTRSQQDAEPQRCSALGQRPSHHATPHHTHLKALQQRTVLLGPQLCGGAAQQLGVQELQPSPARAAGNALADEVAGRQADAPQQPRHLLRTPTTAAAAAVAGCRGGPKRLSGPR